MTSKQHAQKSSFVSADAKETEPISVDMSLTGASSIDISKTESTYNSQSIQTLVLVGKTGNGKSATGNSILGNRIFQSSLSMKSTAKNVVARTNDLIQGQTIEIIDTPGLFDSSVGYKTIGNEILLSINLATNGIHALLIVLSVRNRFSEAEEAAVYYLLDLFGRQIFKYVILVFTGGDNLDEEAEDDVVGTHSEDPLKDYLRYNCPKSLKKILKLCGNRTVLFDNKTNDQSKKSEQVRKLFNLVGEVIAENAGVPYTSKNIGKEAGFLGESSLLRKNIAKTCSKQLKHITTKMESELEEKIVKFKEGICAEQIKKLEAKKQEMSVQLNMYKEVTETTQDDYVNISEGKPIFVSNNNKSLIIIGKSVERNGATANSIMGISTSSCSIKSDVAQPNNLIQGQSIENINTPGKLYHPSLGYETVRIEISECIKLAPNGIHAILIVLSMTTQFSKEEEHAVKLLKELFGRKVYDYVIVVFTGKDEEGEDEERLSYYLQNCCPKKLQEILKQYGSRRVLLDNSTTDQDKKSNQVSKLFSLVDELVKENSTKHGKGDTINLKRPMWKRLGKILTNGTGKLSEFLNKVKH